MSDQEVIGEREKPLLGQVLFDGVLWLIGNFVGATLFSLFTWVVLMAVMPNLNSIIQIQLQTLAAMISSFFILKAASTQIEEKFWSFPLEKITHKKILIAILIAWPFLIVLQSIARSFILHGDLLVRLSPAQATPIPTLTFLIVLFLVLLVPIAEELFYRRWLWTKIEDTAGATKAFWWTATLFWLMHIHLLWNGTGAFYFFGLIPLSLGLSFLRLKCGSFIASLPLHILNNFLAIAPGHILRLVS